MKVRYWGTTPVEDQAGIDKLVARAKKQHVDIEVEYIDVLNNIDRAREGQVVVTPMLDRIEPGPPLRLIAIVDGVQDVLDKLLS